MKQRKAVSRFLSVLFVFGIISGPCFASIGVATVKTVDNRITKVNGDVEIQNDTNKKVTLKNNPSTTAITTSTNKEVATIGWTDTNRTSKVKAVDGNNTTLVNMWIE